MSALSALGGYGSSSEEDEEAKQEPSPTPKPEASLESKPEAKPQPIPSQIPAEPNAPVSSLFSSLPEAQGRAKLLPSQNSKTKSKKKKKHKRKKRKSKAKDSSYSPIPVLSISNEKLIEQKVHEKHTELQTRLAEQQKLLHSDAPQIGPTMPQPSPNTHPTQATSTLQPASPNPASSKSNLWEHNLDPRHMERDVRNFVESGGDLSKFSEHNAFATVDGTKVAAATRAMSKPDSGGEKLSVGYLPTNNYKRRHNISGLVNDAENFETELEERRSKAARGKKSVRSMYGF